VQKEVSDAEYTINHQHFVKTYLNGLVTILARAKLAEPQKQVRGTPTDKDEFVKNLLFVKIFLSDDEGVLNIPDDLIYADPQHLTP